VYVIYIYIYIYTQRSLVPYFKVSFLRFLFYCLRFLSCSVLKLVHISIRVDLCIVTPNAHMFLLNTLMRTVCQEAKPVTILDGIWGLIRTKTPRPNQPSNSSKNHESLKRKMKSEINDESATSSEAPPHPQSHQSGTPFSTFPCCLREVVSRTCHQDLRAPHPATIPNMTSHDTLINCSGLDIWFIL